MSILGRFARRKQVAGDFKKQLKKLIKSAEEQGWRVKITKKNHFKFYPPDKNIDPVTVAGTPSDHRAWMNIRSELKRRGFDWPWDETKPDTDDKEEEAKVETEKKDYNIPNYAEEQEIQEAKEDINFLAKMINDSTDPKEINEYANMMLPDKIAYRKAYKGSNQK